MLYEVITFRGFCAYRRHQKTTPEENTREKRTRMIATSGSLSKSLVGISGYGQKKGATEGVAPNEPPKEDGGLLANKVNQREIIFEY